MNLDAPLKIREQVSFREFGGKLMLVIPPEDELFELNATGRFIWNWIVKRKSIAEIYAKVAETYQLELDEVIPDVDEFIQYLIDLKVVSQA